MSFSCPSVCSLEPANSKRTWKHRAPILHFNWSIQPHVALPLQNLFHFDFLPTLFRKEAAGYIVIKPFGVEQDSDSVE